ncbi:MAG TPA: SAM-dependent methyltransferase [Polyangiaceae bacterium]|nr:SAM-dependent methyltransferase [Polyangiaceae bacterium]
MTPPNEPNSGRILDYWLGGKHHYPMDVHAADQFSAIYSGFPGVFRELRNFIGRGSRYIARQKVSRFLVFGAGIPTQGNVHEAVPDARVYYTDIDEHNVQLGREILASNSKCSYGRCDATDLSTLDRREMESVLGADGPLGIVFVGFACFISDDVLRTTFERLYDLGPVGSFLMADFDSYAFPSAVGEAFRSAGLTYTLRGPAEVGSLLGPWRPTELGILPVGRWGVEEQSRQESGGSEFHYVVMLQK